MVLQKSEWSFYKDQKEKFMTEIDRYIRAKSLAEVFEICAAKHTSEVKFLSGGTDLLLKLPRGAPLKTSANVIIHST